MKQKNKYRSEWECPSNIALVKYWGKKAPQLPLNPSVSFSLKNAKTKTTVEITGSSKWQTEFLFEGKLSQFGERIQKYIDELANDEKWMNDFSFRIESSNTFPHSAGIASSASAFGALALCLADLKKQVTGKKAETQNFFRQASAWARLGSGSACRSVYPQFAVWGKFDEMPDSSNEFAIPVSENIHPDYFTLHDAILLVDSTKKKVSSSAGHQLMNDHPFREARIKQANNHTREILKVMKTGHHEHFFKIVEKEALSLHSMMMTSEPPYLLLHPNSLAIIRKIQDIRRQTNLQVGFTIDAGPNIHFLYFEKDKNEVHRFIKNELLKFTENGSWLDDQIGNGPKKLKA
ncbi:diphosphomevalonate decarboxylase [Tangfeifania diversioriginum]|uniref:diphosphomevalonate decarboxylase n=1 Tax=Tangfeifania diversioriginum TaxID=1168035 RepID=A0A1M6J5N5_9BACT|nr:diphosphomevalonate decarboxylase [Tangfeifania diversioriginum]SHJ42014.1 diphosphomevalonate decarboxylase [Tangfeifania diversioriginum]